MNMKYYVRIYLKKGNIYKDNHGKELKKKNVIDQFNKLYIVPRYKDTKFFNENKKVYAASIDDKGRTQYSYTSEFKEEREKKKKAQLKHFLTIQDSLESKIRRDMDQNIHKKNKLIATLLKLMKICNFRIGNDTYEKEYGSIGLTTLQSKHIRFKGDLTIIEFTGKKKVMNTCNFKHKKLQSILQSLNNRNQYLFSYKNDNNEIRHITNHDVNDYLQEFKITNKDIRMANANLLFLHFFNQYTKNENFQKMNEKDQKKIIRECAEQVAHHLHNTRNVALNSYISSYVIQKLKKKNNNQPIKKQLQFYLN